MKQHFPTFRKAAGKVAEKLGDLLRDAQRYRGLAGGFGRAPQVSYGRLPGSTRDWEREAGNVWDNSAVSILLRWFCNTFCESPIVVKALNDDGGFNEDPLHEMAMRIKRPNRHFTRTQLLKATLLSRFVDGNAYWWKRRSAAGKVVELWWIPHWLIEPRWTDEQSQWLPGGDEFVSYYEYRVDGASTRIPPADIIHFKEGVDPANYRKGLSPLRACLREVCTDNQILVYTYGIMKNSGVPPVMITPTDEGIEVDEETATSAKALWKRATTGDNSGDVMVMSTQWKIDKLGFSPNDLVIDAVGEVGEARLAAAFGIPAVTVGLLVGLRAASAKASHEESKRQAYESGIMPVQRDFCETLDLHLLPELGNELREITAFDTSAVAALQENQTEIATRADAGFRNNVMTLNEARAARGLKDDSALDGYMWQVVPQMSVFGAPGAAEGPKNEPPGEDEGAEDAEDPEEANKKARKAIARYWRIAKAKRSGRRQAGKCGHIHS